MSVDRPSREVLDGALVEECRVRSVQLLRENLVPAGILAASRTARGRGLAVGFKRKRYRQSGEVPAISTAFELEHLVLFGREQFIGR